MNLGSVFRHSKWSMRRKLFGYMMMLAALLVFALLTVFILFGRLNSEQKNTFEELDIQMEFFERNVFTHFDRLAGGGIQLSKDMSALIDLYMRKNPMSFDELSHHDSDIAALQDLLLEPLHQHLMRENCSGAFIMLNATVNRALQDTDYSRTGLYIQRSGYYNNDDTVVLYRGDSDIGKENGILPHTKWRLEIQTDMIPDYNSIIADASLPLKNSYIFTDMFALPGTSDKVILLAVPLFGEDETLYGICGYEISENYFMTYHAQPTRIKNLTCMLVPGEAESLDSDASLSCGGANGYYRAPVGTLTPSNMNGGLTCFSADDVSYVGLTESILLSPGNAPYTLAVMMLKDDYDAAIRSITLQNFFLWALLILLTVISCLYFSRRFLSPILRELEHLKAQDRPNQSDVLEMDDLFRFLSRKDREQERVVYSLEQKRLAALHEKEDLLREYEAAKSHFEAVQLEVSRLSYSRAQEVDPDDYAQFLSGIETLTVSERKVFDYYLAGKSVKEIIELANIKESTLRFHNRNIYGKLGVNSLKQLLRYAALMQQDSDNGI